MRRKWLEARLAELKPISGKSKSGLAKALGVPPSRITEMLDGSRKIHSSEVSPMAKYLEIPEETLLALISGKKSNVLRDRHPIVRVPLIDWVQAGMYTEVTDPYPKGGFEREIDISYPRTSLIALTVQGDSMDLVAPEGSVIIVDYSIKDLTVGKYYIIKHGGSATFKLYKSDPPRFVPFSTNPKHEEIFPNGPVEVVGRVVRVVSEL
jgi:SOS-response transcriptional repressor LexA